MTHPGHRPQEASVRHARRLLAPLLAWLALALIPSSAYAQLLVRQVNLAELSQRAGVIVRGRVVEVRREAHPDYPNIPTLVVTLEVLDNIRGVVDQHFSFRQYLDEIQLQAGAPEEKSVATSGYAKHGYAAGQELLLFLYANSRYGLTSPMGSGQGRFRVLRDRQGRRVVLNDFGNRGLFQDVGAAAQRAGVKLSPEETQLLQRTAGPAELDKLVGLVQRLASERVAP